jgi:Tfp pilus assembly PilM family ATPase
MFKLPIFGKNTQDESGFLAATINSDYVRVLAMTKEGGNIKIVGSAKKDLDQGKVRSGAIIYKDYVANVLREAVKSACAESDEDINNVIIGVSGDLCLGLMTTVRAKRPRPTPVTEKETADIYKKIDETAYLQAQNEYMEINGNSENDLEIITRSDVYTKADNQKVSALEGRECSVVEVASFNAFVPAYHMRTLQEVAHEAGLKIMAVGSEMYCMVQALVGAHEDESDFVLVEIDGDYTNVAVVFGKGIAATRTLNVGYKHFVEGVSERMGLTLLEADKVLKSYIQGKLTTSEATIIQNALRNTLEIWLSGLEMLFAEYSGVKTFAPKIYFTGEGAEVPDLWNLVLNEPWTKSIPFKSPPEFKKLTFMDIEKMSDTTGRVTSSDWLPCMCLSIIKREMEAAK